MTRLRSLEANSRPRTLEVTIVTSPLCHLCDRAHQIFETLRSEVDIALNMVGLDTPEGRAAQARWRAPFPPVVIIDGELFGYGRISERKLMKHLADRNTGRGA